MDKARTFLPTAWTRLINQTTVSRQAGQPDTEEQPSRIRMIGVEVRVGDYALDNSNYVSMRNFGVI